MRYSACSNDEDEPNHEKDHRPLPGSHHRHDSRLAGPSRLGPPPWRLPPADASPPSSRWWLGRGPAAVLAIVGMAIGAAAYSNAYAAPAPVYSAPAYAPATPVYAAPPAPSGVGEMQVKAAKMKLKKTEVAVRYRKRIGKSKVSGTIKGYHIGWSQNTLDNI